MRGRNYKFVQTVFKILSINRMRDILPLCTLTTVHRSKK